MVFICVYVCMEGIYLSTLYLIFRLKVCNLRLTCLTLPDLALALQIPFNHCVPSPLTTFGLYFTLPYLTLPRERERERGWSKERERERVE